MIKAIETRYKDYRFRSRLEARWAVFFDALGIEWEYEKEGYDLDGEWYLPDFWLPNIQGGCWIEIKGREHSESEAKKAILLAYGTGRAVLMFDQPIVVPIDSADASRAQCWWPCESGGAIGCPNFAWHECYSCGKVDLLPVGLWMCCRKQEYSLCTHNPKIREAYAKAMSARFEHGERP